LICRIPIAKPPLDLSFTTAKALSDEDWLVDLAVTHYSTSSQLILNADDQSNAPT
jgi:hypothetical protein